MSKVCVLVVIENASIGMRPHYRFDAFSTVHTNKFVNNRIARFEVRTLRACLKHSFLRYFRSSFFVLRCFRLSTLTRYVCVFVLIHFQERFQIDVVFFMKTLSALVWTKGLNASKYICAFKRKRISLEGAKIY